MTGWPHALAQPVIPLITFWLIPAKPGWGKQAQLLAMAAHTPLPRHLRRSLAAFSSSLFINNKTRDSGTAHTYHPAHEVLASLPLQMMLYFNVYYFPVWCLAEGMMLLLKVPELAGFLLLSFLIQLPLLLFLLTDSRVTLLPLELALHSLLLAFLITEMAAAFLALKTMSKQLAAQFYLRQLKGS
ncbi:transmembrane protein 17B-like isoform X3 [Athene cunicularia]|uniref:transmembrane protein 17B-like isoform X3 n=1 Tax=Athene cunicularia TaxID=194338 RepID=UPI000EF6906D|nr:transmembrane protein 17B-like isoform X3 [Athene cunicularia]